MPVKGESDPIAKMPASCFGVDKPYPTGDVCPTIQEFNSPLDWMLSGMEQYPPYTHEENVAHGTRIQQLRRDITLHAQNTGINLSAVRDGRQVLDDTLTGYFKELYETAITLALHNYPLVRFTFLHKVPGVASDMLNDTQLEASVIQAGLMGIHDAALRYDPSQGSFSRYAVETIRRYMLTEMVRGGGMTPHEYEIYRQYCRLAKQCEKETGTHDVRTVAEILYRERHEVQGNLKGDQKYTNYYWGLRSLLSKLDPISMEDLTGGSSSFAESLTDPDDHFEQTLQDERRQHVEAALLRLSEKERKVLELRFGLHGQKGHMLKEVAQFFNLTVQRILQIEAKGLRKLRHPAIARSLRDYLP